MGNYTEYEWIVGVGCVLAFVTAYGIGANDLANAFASSVGSRALTIRQACVVAAIFEFAGAMGLGANVTSTVRKGVADYKKFTDAPELFMFGMMCVIAATAIWLLLATMYEMPVSTTHSAVGGVIGFAIAARGGDAVIWYKEGKPGEFPIAGVSGIFVSWVFSPVASGVLSALLFWVARTFVLRSKNAFRNTFISLPIWVFVTVTLNMLFILLKGAKTYTGDALTLDESIGISFACGGFCLIASYFPVMLWLKPKVEREVAQKQANGEIVADPENPDRMIYDHHKVNEIRAAEIKASRAAKEEAGGNNIFKTLTKGLDEDVHDAVAIDNDVMNIHDDAEVFDARTEEAFKYLQVFTACCDSFSHGANDVANAVGPFASIWFVYKTKKLSKKTDGIEDDMVWILALGGLGIVVGLATYGYQIMRTIGVKLTKITPSRGFAIELGSALIIVIGARLGLPLSTTHCQVGSTIGVGLMEKKRGVNWGMVPRIIGGWIITLVFVGFTCALFYAMGAYAPSVYGIRDRNAYEDAIEGMAMDWSKYILDEDNMVLSAASAAKFNDDLTALNETAMELEDTQTVTHQDETAMLDELTRIFLGTKDDEGMYMGGLLANANL